MPKPIPDGNTSLLESFAAQFVRPANFEAMIMSQKTFSGESLEMPEAEVKMISI